MRKRKILDMIGRAHRAEAELRIGDCLKEYYWAFLLSHTYPYALCIDQLQPTGSDPASFIASEIRRILNGITIDNRDCYREADVIMAPIDFFYRNNPLRNLRFTYFDGEGRSDGFVENGSADDLPLYSLPTSRHCPLFLSIECAYANEMRLDPEIKALYEIFKSINFITDKSVKLTFAWIEGEDRDAPKPSQQPDVTPQPDKEITVSAKEWSRTVKVLADTETRRDLFKAVGNYLGMQRIRIGTNWQDVAKEGWRIFSIVYDDENVIAVLFFDGRTFEDVKTGRKYCELAEAFGGKRIAWFSERK